MEHEIADTIKNLPLYQMIQYALSVIGGMSLIGFFVVYIIRSLIQLTEGVRWRWTRVYNTYDVMVIDGEYGRLQHIGMFYTEFNTFEIENGVTTDGFIMRIPNDQLGKMKIKKQMSKIQLDASINQFNISGKRPKSKE